MTENTKKLIEELKEVMMDLYRSAGQLDAAIRSIEDEIKAETDTTRIQYFIAWQAEYRERFCNTYNYNKLDKREYDLWQKLIVESKKES